MSWKECIRITEFISWPCKELIQKLYYGPESIVQIFLELRSAWCWDHFQPKPYLKHLQVISLGPVTGHKSENISVCPTALCYEGGVSAMRSPLSLLLFRLKN